MFIEFWKFYFERGQNWARLIWMVRFCFHPDPALGNDIVVKTFLPRNRAFSKRKQIRLSGRYDKSYLVPENWFQQVSSTIVSMSKYSFLGSLRPWSVLFNCILLSFYIYMLVRNARSNQICYRIACKQFYRSSGHTSKCWYLSPEMLGLLSHKTSQHSLDFKL